MRDFEGNARFGERALGANDALGNRWLRDQEGARYFLRSKAAEQTKCKRDARFGGKHRVTGDEDQTEQVVANLVVLGNVEIRHGHILLGLELVAEFLVFAFKEFVPAKEINGAVLRSGHQPGAGIVRDARLRPPLESGNKSILRELFCQTDIADDAGEAGDEPRRLNPPDGVNEAMSIR